MKKFRKIKFCKNPKKRLLEEALKPIYFYDKENDRLRLKLW